MQINDQIAAIILEHKLLDADTLHRLQDKQSQSGNSLVNLLREENLVGEEDIAKLVAEANKIEFINLSPDMIDPMAAGLVPQDVVHQHCLIPVKKQGNKLFIAMSQPLNLAVRDQIQMRTGCEVVPLAATPGAIRQAVRYHYSVQNVTKQTIASMRLKTEDQQTIETQIAAKSDRVANDPITKLVASIIGGAIEAKASDIHIEPQSGDMRVRYRVDGLCRDAVQIPAAAQNEVISHIKILAQMDISEKRLPQDGHIVMSHDGNEFDLRVSTLPAIGGEKIVMRILDKSAGRWSVDSIVTCESDRSKLRQLINNPYGMILLTGPTGCGKTTTLYAMLQELNTPDQNIVTVEDPVEYRLNGITQVQVKAAAGMTFAKALRSIVRQDPDIILVGEIRDIETAEIAVSAALTGHMVLSTLHTNDAAGAVSRQINLGMPAFLVGSALLGSVAQRLVRKVCKHCSEQIKPTSKQIEMFARAGIKPAAIKLMSPAGCGRCFNSGYSGRMAIYEILCVSPQIRRMILDGKDDTAIAQQAVSEGMSTLYISGLGAVAAGYTTLDELARAVDMRGN